MNNFVNKPKHQIYTFQQIWYFLKFNLITLLYPNSYLTIGIKLKQPMIRPQPLPPSQKGNQLMRIQKSSTTIIGNGQAVTATYNVKKNNEQFCELAKVLGLCFLPNLVISKIQSDHSVTSQQQRDHRHKTNKDSGCSPAPLSKQANQVMDN